MKSTSNTVFSPSVYSEGRGERLEFLKKAVREFNTEDFGSPETGYTLTREFGTAPRNGRPETYPKAGAHPRVLFNSEDIPGVKAAIEKYRDSAFVKKFESFLDTEIDGRLGEMSLNSRGFHNWDGNLLANIQAHALAYAVWGDEYFGYSAIYAMKNYLLTLDVDYIKSDQCREFGMVMYIAACVYDWCYPLLSDEDKIQIPLGIEHRLCRGTVKNTRKGILSTSYPVKMEMGFPPRNQAALVGHGSEYQLQRDFLAIAIAVSDELPSWYEFIGGRFFNEYVRPRRIYYEAGLYPQGMSVYAPHRFGGDCCGAALIQAATGTSPYSEDMATALFSFVCNETSTWNMFSTGDGSRNVIPKIQITEHALKVSHILYNTPAAPLLRLIVKKLASPDAFCGAGVTSITAPEAIIYFSREVEELPGDYRDYLPCIWYNGGYVGQYISRSEWGDNAAVTMMRVGEMGTANHDHEDAGTFQLHYKGVTSGASGGYGTYGSTHFKHYHQATVSKNGLLIFDPKLVEEPILKLDDDGNPVIDSYGNVGYLNRDDAFYSGGQRTERMEPASLAVWQSGRYDRAKVTGRADKYMPDGKTPVFTYISSDLTNAYQFTQASFVGRAMMTLFTGDEKYPMALFVFDKIINAKTGLVDKFLLQINGEEAPVIDEAAATVTATGGEGKLVLKNLVGAEKIEGVGGGYEHNYIINGINCQDNSFKPQSAWGRVEISAFASHPISWKNNKKMLNAIYVTDRDNGDAPTLESVSGYTHGGGTAFDGVRFLDNVVLFADDIERVAYGAEFAIPGDGEATCYITGLLEGEWRVTCDGYDKVLTVNADEGILSFTAPAGKRITFGMV